MREIFIVCVVSVLLVGCVPRIQVVAPTKPLTIDMNIKVEHQITIKADKTVADLLDHQH